MPRPWLPRLLTRTARSQAPRHLRDPRRGQKKQQSASRGGPDARHVRAGRVRSREMLGPSLAVAAAGTKPRPQLLRPQVIGCGAPKPRPDRSAFPKPPGGRQRALDPGSLLWASCVSPSASGSRAAFSKREVRGWRPLLERLWRRLG